MVLCSGNKGKQKKVQFFYSHFSILCVGKRNKSLDIHPSREYRQRTSVMKVVTLVLGELEAPDHGDWGAIST